MFIEEYRAILSNRLLKFSDMNFIIENEIAIIELIKCRFGDDALIKCEVMVKDAEDAKRLNHKINQIIQNKIQCSVNVLSISSYYWPSLSGQVEEDLFKCLHPTVLGIFTAYRDAYVELKKPRRLDFFPLLGTYYIKYMYVIFI